MGIGLAARAIGAAPPRDAALRAFYEAHAEAFVRPGRARVEALFFAGDQASSVARAEAARARLMAGEPLAVVASSADAAPREVPHDSVSSTKVANALGYPVAVAVDSLGPGGVTVPMPDARGAWIVRLVDREPARVVPFEEARDEVRVEWTRARQGAR